MRFRVYPTPVCSHLITSVGTLFPGKLDNNFWGNTVQSIKTPVAKVGFKEYYT